MDNHGLIVLYIASQKGGWVYAHELERGFYGGKKLPSESDRRMIELEWRKDVVEHKVGTDVYKIERGREGVYRRYRLVTERSTKQIFEPYEREDGTWAARLTHT